jgi:hypothetical protein
LGSRIVAELVSPVYATLKSLTCGQSFITTALLGSGIGTNGIIEEKSEGGE